VVTYAAAREACVGRWGEPTWQSLGPIPVRAAAWWASPDAPDDGSMCEGIALHWHAGALWISAGHGGESARWPITDATPLPDALGLAAAWLDGRR